MEVYIYDKEGILNYGLISSIVKDLIPFTSHIVQIKLVRV